MRFVLTFIALITLIGVSSTAQTILDSEFKWTKFEECFPKGTNKEIFVKVEEDPALIQYSKTEFDILIGNLIKKFNLAENSNGILKLKILFAKGQNLCVTRIGTKSLELNDNQRHKIIKRFHEINKIKYGRQRNIEVDCLGILYIDITNGEVSKTRNINFKIG